MTAAMLLGAAAGLGVLAVVRGLVPAHPALARALGDLDRAPEPPAAAGALAARALLLARALGLDPAARAADLRIVGRAPEQHALAVLGAALGLAALPPALAGVWAAAGAGAPAPPVLLLVAVPLLAVIGARLPDLDLARRAARRREAFRQTLTSYIDLVAILLAGGAGTESALVIAAELGHGWGFLQLRGALDRSRLEGAAPWASLARLGEELRVGDLGELAATASLAGRQGARVRDSLAARAISLRAAQLAAVEAEAEAATERLTLPMVLLATAFVLFIGYPAVQQVLGNL